MALAKLSTCWVSVPFTSGSSLQHGWTLPDMDVDPRFSSLYIGILAATVIASDSSLTQLRFSSLYIGILAATCQLQSQSMSAAYRFSSLYIGILAATHKLLLRLEL